MHQHTWYQTLKKLNPKLKVCQFENSKHLPGIYYVDEREGIVDICATDKVWVPALPEFGADGFLIKSGYRRVIQILLELKLTTNEKVKALFPGHFESRYPKLAKARSRSMHRQWSEMMQDERKRIAVLGEDVNQVDVEDPIVDKMKTMELENHYRRGSAALSGDQFIELAEEVKGQMSDDQLRDLDEAKFNYDKAVGKRRIIDAK